MDTKRILILTVRSNCQVLFKAHAQIHSITSKLCHILIFHVRRSAVSNVYSLWLPCLYIFHMTDFMLYYLRITRSAYTVNTILMTPTQWNPTTSLDVVQIPCHTVYLWAPSFHTIKGWGDIVIKSAGEVQNPKEPNWHFPKNTVKRQVFTCTGAAHATTVWFGTEKIKKLKKHTSIYSIMPDLCF